MSWVVLILAFVTAERIAELWISRVNTRRLLDQGGREHGARHYPFLVFLHAAWLIALWLLAPGHEIDMFWLAIFVLLQVARIWIIATLGPRWTTRIIVIPGTPLVRNGPFRLLNHPNYWVVVGEIAVLPLVFALPLVALVFTTLNIMLLSIRIREENKALGSLRDPS